MIIIGHRGARGLAAENTAESIRTALDLQVDMIEIDVRVHGKTLVLSHDPTVLTETYTSLQDALAVVNGDVPLILEIKELKCVKKLPVELKNYPGPIIFSSKKFEILSAVRKRFPEAELAVTEKWSGLRAVAEASFLQTNQIHLNHNWLWGGFVRSMKYRGYELFAYTVNNVERAQELEEWGVDGIFTDYPDRFKVQNK